MPVRATLNLQVLLALIALVFVAESASLAGDKRPVKLSQLHQNKPMTITMSADDSAAAAKYGDYLGTYKGGRNVLVTVEVNRGRLALSFRDHRPYLLNDPDTVGQWGFVASEEAWATFDKADDGTVSKVTTFSKAVLPRIVTDTMKVFDSVAENLAPYVGNYKIPNQTKSFGIEPVTEGLGLRMPDSKMKVQLQGPDSTDTLVGILDPHTKVVLTFERDGDKPASAMNLVNVAEFDRVAEEGDASNQKTNK